MSENSQEYQAKSPATTTEKKSKKAFPFAAFDAFWADPDDLVLVETRDDPIFPDLYHKDVHLPIEESLIADILYQGVLEPVLICKGSDGRAYVIDGRQRVKAAREAKRIAGERGLTPPRVPCVSKKGTEADLLAVAVAANEHRHTVSILSRAEQAGRLAGLGKSDQEIATIFGVTKGAVAKWIKLLGLAPKVRQAVEDGKIAAESALKLFDLPVKEQEEALARGFELVRGMPESNEDGVLVTAGAPLGEVSIIPRGGRGGGSGSGGGGSDGEAEDEELAQSSVVSKPKKGKKKGPTAKQMDQVLAGDDPSPRVRMKTRKVVQRRLEEEGEDYPPCCRATLRWVLGLDDATEVVEGTTASTEEKPAHKAKKGKKSRTTKASAEENAPETTEDEAADSTGNGIDPNDVLDVLRTAPSQGWKVKSVREALVRGTFIPDKTRTTTVEAVLDEMCEAGEATCEGGYYHAAS